METLSHEMIDETIDAYEQEFARRDAYLDHLIGSVDTRLTRMQPHIDRLMETRHALAQSDGKTYPLPNSLFDVARPTLERIYDEPTYNDVFVYGYDPRAKLSPDTERKGADLKARLDAKFHEGQTYEEGDYATAILDAADNLGFVTKSVAHATDPLDRRIGIADSELEPVGKVEAVIVPGARSFSNVMRLRDALRNIEQGRVETDTLIVATTDRKVEDDERKKVMETVGFRGGQTEFESLAFALADLTGTAFDTSATEDLPVTLGRKTFDGKLLRVDVTVAGKPLHCMIVSAPFDPERVESYDKDGNPKTATRANTDDTFVATLPLLSSGPGRLLIESHDTWAIGQGVVAEQTFGLVGKEVIATGPRKLDRVVESFDKNGDTRLVLSQPEGVIDEIAKTYAFLTQLRIKADNEKQRINREHDAVSVAAELGVSPESIRDALTMAIPDMDALRERKRKEGYAGIPIDMDDPRAAEPLVRLSTLGIAGQNYYSRPNATVDQPIAGVDRRPVIREGVADTLATINLLAAHPVVTEFFGGDVELYVEDGLRRTSTQNRLYETEVPALIRKQNPSWTEAEVAARRAQIIAAPSTHPGRPSPHSTGAAADVVLRYKQAGDGLFVDGAAVPLGFNDGDTGHIIDPDHFEDAALYGKDREARDNRRAFYALMTGAAFGIRTGLAVNPTEIWHWSRGDQLWALASGTDRAYYGPVS